MHTISVTRGSAVFGLLAAIVLILAGVPLAFGNPPCVSFDHEADPMNSPMGPWTATPCPDPNQQCGITAPTQNTPRPWIVIATRDGKYWGYSDFKTIQAARAHIRIYKPVMNWLPTDPRWEYLGPFPRCDEEIEPNQGGERATLWGPMQRKATEYKRQYERVVAEVRRYFREGKRIASVKFLGELYVAQSEAENLIAAVSELREDAPDSAFADLDQALVRYKRAFDRLRMTRQKAGMTRIPAVPPTQWTRTLPARMHGPWAGTFTQQNGYTGNAELIISPTGAVELTISYRIELIDRIIAETLRFTGTMVLAADKRSFRATLRATDGTTAEVEGTVNPDGTLTGTYLTRVWVPPQPEINWPGHYETDTGPFTLRRSWTPE